MNTFILVKNETDTNTTMWEICTKNKKGNLDVWGIISDDALYDAGDQEIRNGNKYLMDFTLTEVTEETKQ